MTGVNMKIKLKDDGVKVIQEILTTQFNQFGPFSKDGDQSDVLVAIRAMETGGEMKSSKVKKEHLSNIIKALIAHQNWAEKFDQTNEADVTEQIGNENGSEINNVEDDQDEEIEDDQSDQIGEKSEPAKNIKQERKFLQNVCKFYRAGKCIYGMSGKNRDKRGNICPYEHPEICKKYKMFEDKEKGCQIKDCNKMHVKHCKYYNTCKDYKDNDNCRFYHPKKKQKLQVKGNNQTSFQPKEENRYLQENKRKFECNNCVSSENKDFLGQKYPSQISSWVWENQSQAHQYKQPFTGPEKMQEQNKLNQMKGILTNMEMLVHQVKSTMLC